MRRARPRSGTRSPPAKRRQRMRRTVPPEAAHLWRRGRRGRHERRGVDALVAGRKRPCAPCAMQAKRLSEQKRKMQATAPYARRTREQQQHGSHGRQRRGDAPGAHGEATGVATWRATSAAGAQSPSRPCLRPRGGAARRAAAATMLTKVRLWQRGGARGRAPRRRAARRASSIWRVVSRPVSGADASRPRLRPRRSSRPRATASRG